jgi:pantoate--beta-alanine ligase
MKNVKKITDDMYEENLFFIPTMGSLHRGHFSLIEEAKKSGLKTVVSIFVNPKQFNDTNDYQKYPRDIQKDSINLEKLNVDYLFTPDENYIYGDSFSDLLSSGHIGEQYEGKSRPGHFDGVLTVVNRLFELIKPKKVIFGKKDAQQLFLIKDYIGRTNKDINLLEGEIVRDKLGLALSSRNVLLSAKGKETASGLKKQLDTLKEIFLETGLVSRSIEKTLQRNKDGLLEIDYLEILDKDTFSAVSDNTKNFIIIIAGYVEGIRLIDNIDFRIEG